MDNVRSLQTCRNEHGDLFLPPAFNSPTLFFLGFHQCGIFPFCFFFSYHTLPLSFVSVDLKLSTTSLTETPERTGV